MDSVCLWDFQVEPSRQDGGYVERGPGWAGDGITSSRYGLETICWDEVTMESQPGVKNSSLGWLLGPQQHLEE